MLDNGRRNKYVVFGAMAVASLIIIVTVGWIMSQYLIPWVVDDAPYSYVTFVVIFIAAVIYYL